MSAVKTGSHTLDSVTQTRLIPPPARYELVRVCGAWVRLEIDPTATPAPSAVNEE